MSVINPKKFLKLEKDVKKRLNDAQVEKTHCHIFIIFKKTSTILGGQLDDLDTILKRYGFELRTITSRNGGVLSLKFGKIREEV